MICNSSHNFQSLTVNPRFAVVPTVSEFNRKSMICNSSHNFQSLIVNPRFVIVPTIFRV
ncbi:hypothetical protein LEP1GSC035_4461 [Leptospira noguchii str. 2007001578]|uniref:Uncharacterized protein n=2 Tax=Leptospira noguchii TaxID=28182 RepID=M6YY20_9LEPT|nr:hypothetical protein LEP1GSC035_4461 [Leptospira noguchii str. 2007001578]EMO91233.1 hypothetical protein LEP1GSC024_0221 [Leptospira noguchii str. 2001034031]